VKSSDEEAEYIEDSEESDSCDPDIDEPEEEDDEAKEVDLEAYLKWRAEDEKAQKQAQPLPSQGPKEEKVVKIQIAPEIIAKNQEPKIIYFYDKKSERVQESNIYLNNFHESPFVIEGITYPTVEHYYQCMKFAGPKYKQHFENVLKEKTPDNAKDLATKIFHSLKDDDLIVHWEEAKIGVMRKALHEKFTQHSDLLSRLLSTGNAKLIEDSPFDSFWGGFLPNSKNILGILLMQLRNEKREKATS